MRRHPIAGAYARALLAIGKERGAVDDYYDELGILVEEVLSTVELKVFFESPKIPRDEKKNVLDHALRGKISDPIVNLLKVLIDRGRQMLFEQIVESYREMYDAYKGRAYVRVDSATPLSSARSEELTQLLGKKLNRYIIMEERVNDHLLGGMTIRIGDTVIDGSIRTQLNRIKEAVTSPRLGAELVTESDR